MILLAATLWFAQPAPLEMPRASAYLVKDAEGALWLEDRYDEADLWTARTVLSRWSDREGRRFTVAKLETIAPTVEGPTLTRERFVADEMPLPDKREDLREQAIALLAPFDLPEEPSAPRRDVHGFKEVRYYQGTSSRTMQSEHYGNRRCLRLPSGGHEGLLPRGLGTGARGLDRQCRRRVRDRLSREVEGPPPRRRPLRT